VLMVLSSLILGGFALIHMGYGSPQLGFDFSFFIGFMICVIWTVSASPFPPSDKPTTYSPCVFFLLN
jgi:hypothetical protein